MEVKMQLNRQVSKMLKNMENMVSSINYIDFQQFAGELADLRKRLEEPLRVAIVGVMKAGKSTLMNAILKEKILYTNTLEATYTVSWFRYGEQPKLLIVMKDGHEFTAPFEELERWTVRPKDQETTEIDEVKHVVIYYPNEILKIMELIDTPGLESTFQTDSNNTLSFLGQKLEKEANRMTSETASQAEAIVYAFSRGANGKDAEVLDAFRGDSAKNSSPINAVGIFTKVDVYWDAVRAAEKNPFDLVKPALDGYKLSLRDRLYTILPVIAKPVETISEITDEVFDILLRLSLLDTSILMEFLMDAFMFINEPEDSDMTISCSDRKKVLDLFGQYGIYQITNALKKGITRSYLADYLYELCGIEKAAHMIQSHFGNRAFLIKLDYVLKRIHTIAIEKKHQNINNLQQFRVCERICEDIEKLREEEQAFRELELLQLYYNGGITFTDEKQELQFLELTGEYGSSCEYRLGFCKISSLKEMKKEAMKRSKYWNSIYQDWCTPDSLKKVASVLMRSCDILFYHLDMLSGFEED